MTLRTFDAPAEYQVATDATAVPHSRESEEAVVGAVLINPEVFHECRIHLGSGNEFYIHRLKWIWEAYEKMFARKVPVDLLTLANELESAGQLQEIGGPAYLTSLVNQVPSSLNAASYAAIVHGFFVRRRMINAANKVAEIAYDQSIPLDAGISQATHELSQATATAFNKHSSSINDGLKKLDEKLEERSKQDSLPGIPSGLIDLDRALGGGFQDSDLILIPARPRYGKTSLLLQILKHAAEHTKGVHVYKKRVVLFSQEMPEEQLLLRMISQVSGIDYQVLRSGKIPERQYPLYINALDKLSPLDITIDDTPRVSPDYIFSRCEILNSEQKLDMIFIDSLDLLRSNLRFGKPSDEVNDNAKVLKEIAREFNIPLLSTHAMNRGIEYRSDNAKPKLSDLREGGDSQADVVIFIWHECEDDQLKNIKSSELIIAKQRNGPMEDIPVVFRGAQTKFESAFKPRGSD